MVRGKKQIIIYVMEAKRIKEISMWFNEMEALNFGMGGLVTYVKPQPD